MKPYSIRTIAAVVAGAVTIGGAIYKAWPTGNTQQSSSASPAVNNVVRQNNGIIIGNNNNGTINTK